MARRTAEELREKARQLLEQAKVVEQQKYIEVGKIVLRLLEKKDCSIEEIRDALKKVNK